MCLTTSTDLLKRSQVGWKKVSSIFKLEDIYYVRLRGGLYRIGTWHFVNTNPYASCIENDRGFNYPNGFHIFMNQTDAINYGGNSKANVLKVKWNLMVAKGKQRKNNIGDTIVALAIKILPCKKMVNVDMYAPVHLTIFEGINVYG